MNIVNRIIEALTPLYNKSRDNKYEYIINAKNIRSKDYNGKWKEIRRNISKADQSLMDWGKDVIYEKLTKKYNKYLENIAKKLSQKIETLNVLNIEYKEISAYDIELIITTTEGKKSLSINTIMAGGYNVQCLHYRTTIKLKNIRQLDS